MTRLVVVLSGLLVLPAFAEVAPIDYFDTIEMSDVDVAAMPDAENDAASVQGGADNDVAPVVPTTVSSRNSGRTTSSRAVPNSGARANVTNSVSNSTRNLTTRTTSVNPVSTARTTVSRASATRAGAVASRASGASANTATRSVVASRNIPNSIGNARNATSKTAARASIVQTDTVNSPLYTGRVSTSNSVRARVPAVRMSSASTTTGTTVVSAESNADAAATMDELAQMTDYCKAQYTQCMDNFCNVLDDNQGRCSCSANLKNYAKTEAALKEATENLQNVAQQIRYIGLTSDQVESLFAQTEAELSMANSSDNSALKNDLDRIKNMIVDVKSGAATTTSDTGMAFDLSGLLDFNIDSTGFDLTTLFGVGTANTSSISNQRGAQLYKTASSRCKAAVLNSCGAQGVDVSVITDAYDLEIDKHCMAYERSLTDANDQMSSTVRNAKSMLQQARLLVAQQKNSYDTLVKCVSALDNCMQGEFVCGTDYENCLDPTGKYIVNGEIVVGGTPGVSGGGLTASSTAATPAGLYSVWDYKVDSSSHNAFGDGSVADFVNAGLYKSADATTFNSTATSMAQYLQQKIGYVNSDGKSMGMCVSELNKCQDFTYTGSNKAGKTYNPQNDVIRTYLERVSMQIKAAQDEKLAEYAENCISDVAECLSQNNYTSLGLQNNTDSVSAVATAACRPVIDTCMSATGYGTNIEANVYNWLQSTLNVTVSGAYSELADIKTAAACAMARGTWSSGSCDCPTNATFQYGACQCNTGYNWDENNFNCVRPSFVLSGLPNYVCDFNDTEVGLSKNGGLCNAVILGDVQLDSVTGKYTVETDNMTTAACDALNGTLNNGVCAGVVASGGIVRKD